MEKEKLFKYCSKKWVNYLEVLKKYENINPEFLSDTILKTIISNEIAKARIEYKTVNDLLYSLGDKIVDDYIEWCSNQ